MWATRGHRRPETGPHFPIEAQLAGMGPSAPTCLGDIAYARSGDKGIHANIGVIARRPEDFARLCQEVTPQRVAAFFGIADASRVVRYELPNLAAINLVIRGILADPLRVDAQGKALGQILLEMPLERAGKILECGHLSPFFLHGQRARDGIDTNERNPKRQ